MLSAYETVGWLEVAWVSISRSYICPFEPLEIMLGKAAADASDFDVGLTYLLIAEINLCWKKQFSAEIIYSVQ